MSTRHSSDLDRQSDTTRVGTGMALAGAVTVGMIAAVWVLTQMGGTLAASLQDKGYWYLVRATGVVAYLQFWLVMVLGLLMSNKVAKHWPGSSTAFALHQFISLNGIVFAAVHALLLLGDRFLHLSAWQLVLPFAIDHALSVWIGVGQLGFYLLAVVMVSDQLRPHIGTAAWRWLHYAAFVGFMAVTVHGLLAGSDSRNPLMLGLYASTGLVVLFLLLYRMVALLYAPAAAKSGCLKQD